MRSTFSSFCRNPSELHHELAITCVVIMWNTVRWGVTHAGRKAWPDLHEVAPALTSQNRKSLTGHVEDGIMGDPTDQLQPCITIQNLAVRQQPCILWSLSPGLYTCQETYKHHAVGIMLWCGYHARHIMSC